MSVNPNGSSLLQHSLSISLATFIFFKEMSFFNLVVLFVCFVVFFFFFFVVFFFVVVFFVVVVVVF